MRLALTTAQRRICIGAALTIGAMLLYQADEVGFEETPWLIGSLVVTALLICAFSSPRQSSDPAPTSVAHEIAPFQALRAAIDVIEAEFMPIAERSNSAFKQNEMTRAFANHVRLQALKLAWIATALTLEKRYPGFRKGQRFKGFNLMGGTEALKWLRDMPGIEGPNARKLSIEASAKELGRCTVALDLTIAKIGAQQEYPLNHAYEIIEQDFPFAQVTQPSIIDHGTRLDAAYGPIFRRAVAAAQVAR